VARSLNLRGGGARMSELKKETPPSPLIGGAISLRGLINLESNSKKPKLPFSYNIIVSLPWSHTECALAEQSQGARPTWQSPPPAPRDAHGPSPPLPGRVAVECVGDGEGTREEGRGGAHGGRARSERPRGAGPMGTHGGCDQNQHSTNNGPTKGSRPVPSTDPGISWCQGDNPTSVFAPNLASLLQHRGWATSHVGAVKSPRSIPANLPPEGGGRVWQQPQAVVRPARGSVPSARWFTGPPSSTGRRAGPGPDCGERRDGIQRRGGGGGEAGHRGGGGGGIHPVRRVWGEGGGGCRHHPPSALPPPSG